MNTTWKLLECCNYYIFRTQRTKNSAKYSLVVYKAVSSIYFSLKYSQLGRFLSVYIFVWLISDYSKILLPNLLIGYFLMSLNRFLPKSIFGCFKNCRSRYIYLPNIQILELTPMQAYNNEKMIMALVNYSYLLY